MQSRILLLPVFALAFAGCNSPQESTTTVTEVPQSPETTVTTTTTTTTMENAVAARPSEATGAFVRGVHVVPGAGPIELREESNSLVKGATFGNASPFVEVALKENKGTKLRISAFGEGNTKVAGPMPVMVSGGEDLSVVVNGVPGNVVLMPFKHKNHGSAAGKAKIAFLHAAKGLPPVSITVDGKSFRKSVGYGIATDYETIAPGRHTMKVDYTESLAPVVASTPILPPDVTPAPPVVVKPRQHVALTQEMDLVAGQVYSITVFYDAERIPKLTLLEDKFVPTLKNAPKEPAP